MSIIEVYDHEGKITTICCGTHCVQYKGRLVPADSQSGQQPDGASGPPAGVRPGIVMATTVRSAKECLDWLTDQQENYWQDLRHQHIKIAFESNSLRIDEWQGVMTFGKTHGITLHLYVV